MSGCIWAAPGLWAQPTGLGLGMWPAAVCERLHMCALQQGMPHFPQHDAHTCHNTLLAPESLAHPSPASSSHLLTRPLTRVPHRFRPSRPQPGRWHNLGGALRTAAGVTLGAAAFFGSAMGCMVATDELGRGVFLRVWDRGCLPGCMAGL